MPELAKRNGVTEKLKPTPNGMGASDERLQGTGRGNCENRIDLRLSEEVRAESCSDFSHISKMTVELFTILRYNLNMKIVQQIGI